jgi:hypothetical protein
MSDDPTKGGDAQTNTNNFYASKRYEYLVKARNYHYTNFNIWMMFFLVAVGGLFIGYYTLVKDNNHSEILLISFIGYFVSLLWHWSCKGYHWWEINWIRLIIKTEEHLKDEERIYSCFVNKHKQGSYWNPIKSANVSTSQIVLLFSFVIASTWSFIFYITCSMIAFKKYIKIVQN